MPNTWRAYLENLKELGINADQAATLKDNSIVSKDTDMTIELDLPTDKIKGVIKGAAGHIIFNNPERHNAVSLEMWDAVEMALNALQNDDVRIVIRLVGWCWLCFGADISNLCVSGSKDATEHYNARLKVVYDTIENHPKPTMAMINGHCIGGGLNLAACTDIRVASDKSRLTCLRRNWPRVILMPFAD